jgi:FixJ family two-component response regulator
VDDEAIVRRALERLLRASGFRVTTFPSAEAFLAHLAADRPDCLVLDLHLGGMTGLNLQGALASRGDPIPCIVITAHDDPLTRSRCLLAGAVAYLAKPFDDSELIEPILRALGVTPTDGDDAE